MGVCTTFAFKNRSKNAPNLVTDSTTQKKHWSARKQSVPLPFNLLNVKGEREVKINPVKVNFRKGDCRES